MTFCTPPCVLWLSMTFKTSSKTPPSHPEDPSGVELGRGRCCRFPWSERQREFLVFTVMNSQSKNLTVLSKYKQYRFEFLAPFPMSGFENPMT